MRIKVKINDKNPIEELRARVFAFLYWLAWRACPDDRVMVVIAPVYVMDKAANGERLLPTERAHIRQQVRFRLKETGGVQGAKTK